MKKKKKTLNNVQKKFLRSKGRQSLPSPNDVVFPSLVRVHLLLAGMKSRGLECLQVVALLNRSHHRERKHKENISE